MTVVDVLGIHEGQYKREATFPSTILVSFVKGLIYYVDYGDKRTGFFSSIKNRVLKKVPEEM